MKEGVETHSLACSFGKVANNSLKLSVVSLGRTDNFPPLVRVGYKSITDKSKEYGGWEMQFTSSLIPKSFSIQPKKLNKLSWLIYTPLGTPVVPDVKII